MLAATSTKRLQYEPEIPASYGYQGTASAAFLEWPTQGQWRPSRQLPAEGILLAPEEATRSALAWTGWLWFSGQPATTAYVEVRLPAASEAARVLAHSPAEMLAAVRAHLSLSMVDVAAALEVERPTIYAWLAGRSEPQERNRKRLHRLFEVARRWSRISSAPVGARLRHPAGDGTSLLDLLRSGRFEEAEARLDALARTGPAQEQDRKVRSIQELLARHGLEKRIRPSRDEIDRLTGKSAPE